MGSKGSKGSKGSWAPPPIPPKSHFLTFVGPGGLHRPHLCPLLPVPEVLACPLARFGAPCVDFGQIFGPRTPKRAASWPPPCAPGLRFSNEFLGFPRFTRFTLKVATLTPRGVPNDPKKHPKPPKSLPKGTQREPQGYHRGTIWHSGGSLGPLWAPDGSSGATLGTLWGCLGPLRGPLWRLRPTLDTKMIRKASMLIPFGVFFGGALGRFSGSF